jgi:hypothetical protein
MKGHVSKRGKTWAYWFDIDPDPLTGKRRQQTKSGFKSERGAWKACRAAMTDYEKGLVVSSSRRKVADALEEWLRRIEHSVKPSMIQNASAAGTAQGPQDLDGGAASDLLAACAVRPVLRAVGP